MDARNQHKLDPRLRRRADRRAARPRAAGAEAERDTAQVFVEVVNPGVATRIKDLLQLKDMVQVVDGYYTATVPPEHFTELADQAGVIEVEAVRFFRPHLDRSVPSIHADEDPPAGGGELEGKGVVIGLVDYGLDFTQKDFQNPVDGTTRIAWLWDQELNRREGENAPDKYGYGVEYSGAEIDKALQAKRLDLIRHDPLSAEDIRGHGTHVAGIAAGNGQTADKKFRAGRYVGVAPAATIVFVNLNRQDMIEQLDAPRGTFANSVHIAHGVAYCFEKAEALGMPCVVNLSLGSNGGGHDGNMVLEWIIDALLRKPGRAVVIAAGNEDHEDWPVHATDTLKKGEKTDLKWKVGGGDENGAPSELELEVWYPRGNAIGVLLVAPDGTESDEVEPGETGTKEFAGGEEFSAYSDAETPWNGAARIHIELSDPSQKKGIRSGTWIVRLRAISVAKNAEGGVRFDAWIERSLPAVKGQPEGSRFGRYDRKTAINVTTPATARLAISVACCLNDGSDVPQVSDFSGRGPTRDERRKPELAAPGEYIISTGTGPDDPTRRKLKGTSQAAPHVSGVVARMLSRNAYLTAEEICDVLIKSATRRGAAPWDSKRGYGNLNAARAVELVEQMGSLTQTAPQKQRRRRR